MAESAAVDRGAEGHDEGLGRNPVALVFRHLFQERLAILLPPAARVLNLGCGTGEDALFLAKAGWRVLGLDPAPASIEAAREKARRQGMPANRLCFEVAAAEEIGKPSWGHGPFDAACSGFEALNRADLVAVGAGLRRVLDVGAPLLLSLLGPHPLPALIEKAVAGKGDGRRGTPRGGGGPLAAVAYPSRREAQELLGSGFEWQDGFGLGVLLPAPAHAAWAADHPQAFGVLAALEGLIRRWPLLRDLGDRLVLEGRRR